MVIYEEPLSWILAKMALFVSLFWRNKQLAEATFAKHIIPTGDPLGGQVAIGYPATRVAGLGRCAQFGFREAYYPRKGTSSPPEAPEIPRGYGGGRGYHPHMGKSPQIGIRIPPFGILLPC